MVGLAAKKSGVGGIGVLYLLKLTIGISLLMIANSYVVGLVVQANLPFIPDFFNDIRLFQFCQVFVPFLMVLIQFMVYDRIRDRMSGVQVAWRPQPEGPPGKSGGSA